MYMNGTINKSPKIHDMQKTNHLNCKNTLSYPFLLLFTLLVDTRHCYQCADTSRDGDCQTKLKTMAKAAYYILEPLISAEDDAYNRKRDLYNQYVKNCTSYLQDPSVTYCVIETHEYRGKHRVQEVNT